MEIKKVALNIIRNVEKSVGAIDKRDVLSVIDVFMEAYREKRKVIIIGMGRSGLVGRAFAMRLMHLGFNVHVVGETITPAMREGDILLAVSGSGTTTFVVASAEIAKKVGGKIISITSYPESILGRLSDLVVKVPGRTKEGLPRNYFSRQILGEHEPLVPLGTLFEISAMVFLDSLIVELMKRLGKTEEELKKRHATIE